MLVTRYRQWQQEDRLAHPGSHLFLSFLMLVVAVTQIPGLLQFGWDWLPVIVIVGCIAVAVNEWVQLWRLHKRKAI